MTFDTEDRIVRYRAKFIWRDNDFLRMIFFVFSRVVCCFSDWRCHSSLIGRCHFLPCQCFSSCLSLIFFPLRFNDNALRTDILALCHILCALDPALLFDLFFRVLHPFKFRCFCQGFCRKLFHMFSFRDFVGKDPGQFSTVQNHKFMQCAGRSHIQKFDMPVIRRVFFLRRIKQQHSIKFKSFRVGDRKHHDAIPELGFFQICFYYFYIFL